MDNRSSLCESQNEERANSISHGIGAGLSVVALIWMVYLAKPVSAWHVTGVSLFGASLILLYLSSAIYHAVSSGKAKRLFQILDHSFIFVLIAGSYMPWLLVNIRGPWGWSIFGIVWGLAIAGIVLKAVFLPRFEKIGALIYVLMGWLICIPIKPLIEQTSSTGIGWLIAGGLCYTFGVYFYLKKSLKFGHLIWHLFVMAGSACHVFAVVFGVIPHS